MPSNFNFISILYLTLKMDHPEKVANFQTLYKSVTTILVKRWPFLNDFIPPPHPPPNSKANFIEFFFPSNIIFKIF